MAHSPALGPRPRRTISRAPFLITTPPTPGVGRRGSSVISVVHNDGTRREASRFEEVLDEPVAGEHMGVEHPVATLTKMLEDGVPHCLAHPNFTGFQLSEDKPDRTYPLASRLGEERFGPGQDEPEDDLVDRADIDDGVGVFEGLRESLGHRLGKPIGKLPHPVVRMHLGGQKPVEPNELLQVVRNGQSCVDPPGTYRLPIAKSALSDSTASTNLDRSAGSCEKSASISQMTWAWLA